MVRRWRNNPFINPEDQEKSNRIITYPVRPLRKSRADGRPKTMNIMLTIENYVAPEVEIIEVAVEKGFATSTALYMEDEAGDVVETYW